jgi:hypothetical protein
MGIATAVAVGSLAVGAYSAVQQGKAADRAADAQGRAVDAQAQVAQNQLDFGKEQYADWKNLFMPALTDLRSMAYEQVRPNFAAISADVDTAFDTSQGVNRRNMERYGIKPTDGAFNASETQYGLGRAMATVNANNQARTAAKDQQFNRLASFANLSQGMQATANNTVNSGFGSQFNAYGNQANLYGSQAAGYAGAAAAGANMFGRGLSYFANGGAGGGGGGTDMAGFDESGWYG